MLTTNFDLSQLDCVDHNVRIRLGNTVARVANRSDHGVDLGVVSHADGSIRRLRAKHATLACFNMAIPYLLPELAPEQAAALALNVKAPLVYTNVVVRNWHPWVKLGIHEVYGVNTFHSRMKLDYPVVLGSYACARDPSEPIVIHMVHVPTIPQRSDPRAALREARKTLFSRSFEDFESHIKSDLTRVLGPGGFDAERDIAAICVNRWSHGYSYSLNTLTESEAEGQRLQELARRRVGNVTIANSDAGWDAYAHSAIDQAHRAVAEFSELV